MSTTPRTAGRSASARARRRQLGRRAGHAPPARQPAVQAAVARAARPAALESLGAALQPLQALRDALQEIRLKLAAVDVFTLSDAEKAQLNEQIDATDLALLRVRNAELAVLSEAFKAEQAGLEAATRGLADDLQRVQKAAQVIETVAAVLGSIEKIARLLA